MVKVDVTSVINEAQIDGIERYFHEAKGWATFPPATPI